MDIGTVLAMYSGTCVYAFIMMFCFMDIDDFFDRLGVNSDLGMVVVALLWPLFVVALCIQILVRMFRS